MAVEETPRAYLSLVPARALCSDCHMIIVATSIITVLP